jgi:hypothetical protein
MTLQTVEIAPWNQTQYLVSLGIEHTCWVFPTLEGAWRMVSRLRHTHPKEFRVLDLVNGDKFDEEV